MSPLFVKSASFFLSSLASFKLPVPRPDASAHELFVSLNGRLDLRALHASSVSAGSRVPDLILITCVRAKLLLRRTSTPRRSDVRTQHVARIDFPFHKRRGGGRTKSKCIHIHILRDGRGLVSELNVLFLFPFYCFHISLYPSEGRSVSIQTTLLSLSLSNAVKRHP